MTEYRRRLPQLDGRLFLTDGGFETTLVFHEGHVLPYFAAFDLLTDKAGQAMLRRYFERYAALARDGGSASCWRRRPGARTRTGRPSSATTPWRSLTPTGRGGAPAAHRAAVRDRPTPIVISGNLGPRGDGYVPGARMSAARRRTTTRRRSRAFAASEADMVAAFTMNYVEEAIGIVRAAHAAAMPVAISFTLETDGRLPSGKSLAEAIEDSPTRSRGVIRSTI